MSNLDNIYKTWEDLDASYENMAKTLNCKNKNEFIKAMTYTKDGSLIQRLKIILKDESVNYNEEEMVKYSDLLSILTAVEFYMDNHGVDDNEIVSLKEFVTEAMIYREYSLKPGKIKESDIIGDLKNSVEELDSKEVFRKYGEVNSFAGYSGRKAVAVLVNDFFCDKFVVITPSNIAKFKEYCEKDKDNKFLLKCVDKLVNLARNNVEVSNGEYVFVSSDLTEGDKILGRKCKVESDCHYNYRGIDLYIV